MRNGFQDIAIILSTRLHKNRKALDMLILSAEMKVAAPFDESQQCEREKHAIHENHLHALQKLRDAFEGP